ncbi:MAG: phosphoribosyl-AMP cyclohydrolase [Victivallales bacterium]|nr:phosphoribosyl-AMP cyclohydrolase [Victivallales bacterium]
MIELDFSKGNGLIPAIAQDYQTNEILMMAYINREAWEATLRTGQATYWSRSRGELWIKGATSGNIQHIREILVDCDLDTVVFKVEQDGGAACHLGYRSCFFRRVADDHLEIVGARIFDPKQVYQQ